MTTKRRHRLTPRDGIECFEVRSVTYLDCDGKLTSRCEVTWAEDSGEPGLHEVLGALRLAERDLIALYDEDS